MGPSGKKEPVKKSRYLSIAGKSVAIGMHWHVHNYGNKRAVSRASSECKASFGFSIDSDGRCLTGFYNGSKAGKKLYAGAAIVASVYEQGIFVLPCSDDEYWLLVVSKGQPICGYDLICDA